LLLAIVYYHDQRLSQVSAITPMEYLIRLL